NTEDVKFPPKPPSEQLIQKVIHEFSSSQNPALIEESGCAVCGTLCPKSKLAPLNNFKDKLTLLIDNGRSVTRKERTHKSHHLNAIPGPVIETKFDKYVPLVLRLYQKIKHLN
ncbi:hypothetical protein GLOTRDRAFT_50892, partial [Gloeophyllum trabeum ATCC 11539]